MKYSFIIIAVLFGFILNSCQQDVVTAEKKKHVDTTLSAKGWVEVDTYDHSKETPDNFSKLVTASANLVWVADLDKVYGSTDGGIVWKTIVDPNIDDSTVAIQLLDDNIGFAAYAVKNVIYKTNDGGSTFTKIEPQISEGGSTSFWSTGNEYEFGYCAAGAVNYTSDNGLTWQNIKTPLQYDQVLYLFSGGSFFVGDFLGSNHDFYYYTYGVPYSHVGQTLYPTAFYFNSPTNGWAADLKNYMLHSTNGGQIWYDAGDLHLEPFDHKIVKIRFVDNDNGWLLVHHTLTMTSSIYATNDGGKNWTIQYDYTGLLQDIFMVDKNIGYAVGKGIVLKTGNGGWQ